MNKARAAVGLLALAIPSVLASGSHAVVLGDVNQDQAVDAHDLAKLRAFLRKEDPVFLSPPQLRAADVAPLGVDGHSDPDGLVDMRDLLVLARGVSGEFRPEPPTNLNASGGGNPVSVTGLATPGAQIRVYVNGALQPQATTSDTGGSFSIPAYLADRPGSNDLELTETIAFIESAPSASLPVPSPTSPPGHTVSGTYTVPQGATEVWSPGDPSTPFTIGSAGTSTVVEIRGELVVLPGTNLEFHSDSQLHVLGGGSLAIAGEASDPVVLTSADATPASCGSTWNGVRLVGGAHVINHARIECAVSSISLEADGFLASEAVEVSRFTQVGATEGDFGGALRLLNATPGSGPVARMAEFRVHSPNDRLRCIGVLEEGTAEILFSDIDCTSTPASPPDTDAAVLVGSFSDMESATLSIRHSTLTRDIEARSAGSSVELIANDFRYGPVAAVRSYGGSATVQRNYLEKVASGSGAASTPTFDFRNATTQAPNGVVARITENEIRNACPILLWDRPPPFPAITDNEIEQVNSCPGPLYFKIEGLTTAAILDFRRNFWVDAQGAAITDVAMLTSMFDLTTAEASDDIILDFSDLKELGQNSELEDVPVTVQNASATFSSLIHDVQAPAGVFRPTTNLGDTLELTFELLGDADVTIEWWPELDSAMSGTPVRTIGPDSLSGSSGSGARQSVFWDGRNDVGIVVPDEAYVPVLIADRVNTSGIDTTVASPATPASFAGFATTFRSGGLLTTGDRLNIYRNDHLATKATSPEPYRASFDAFWGSPSGTRTWLSDIAAPAGDSIFNFDLRDNADNPIVADTLVCISSSSSNCAGGSPSSLRKLREHAVIVRSSPSISGPEYPPFQTGGLAPEAADAPPRIEVRSTPYVVIRPYDQIATVDFCVEGEATNLRLAIHDPNNPVVNHRPSVPIISLADGTLNNCPGPDYRAVFDDLDASPVSAPGNYPFTLQADAVASGATTTVRGFIQIRD